MNLFIFGSTGDLVKRKILPALHKFENLNIYVLGRKKLDNEQYNQEYCEKCSKEFKLRLNYKQISFEDEVYLQLYELLSKNEVNYFYISMPPNFQVDLINKILEIKRKGFKIQVLIEKPFGSSLNDAELLQDLIKKNKLEKEIYLSDHYLFKESLFNLKEVEFNKLKIVSNENLGIEKRIYYDSVGALKDMVQSHFLNILHKLINFSESDFEVKLFERGQYKDYEKEIEKESNTETYVKIILNIKDKEIEFETGKKLLKKESFMEIDKVKIDISLNSQCYCNLFESFFNKRKEKFPTIKNSIINWKIIEKINKSKENLFYY